MHTIRSTYVLTAALLVSAAMPLCAGAQEASSTVRVRLVDRTELPVPGLLVQLLGPTRQVEREAVSDADGIALLRDLAHGSYEMRILSAPYADVYRVVEVHAVEVTVDVTLRPTGIEERVTITAARGALQEESKIPATVRSLDAVRLQARAVDLLPRMLDEEPGILTQQTTPGQGSPILRGQSAQAVLYLLDGVRYNNATYRAGNTQYLAWIPDGGVDSVEALLGPAGVNYGSDALGGAVNVISRPVPGFTEGDTRWSGSARAFGESASYGGGFNATVGAAGRRWGAYLATNGGVHGVVRSGGGRDSHHATVRYLGFTDQQVRDAFGSRLVDTGFSNAGLSAKVSLRTDRTSTLGAYLVTSEQFDVRRYDRLLGGEGRVTADFDPQRLTFGYLRFQKNFAETFIEATASFNRQTDGRRDRRRPSSALRTERNSVDAFGFEVTASTSAGDHLLTAGFEVYDEHGDARRTESRDGVTRVVRPRFPNGADYRSLGLFLLDEWSALDGRLSISGGARYSAFRYGAAAADNVIDGSEVLPDAEATFDDLTFNLGVNYALGDAVGVWGRMARGFRAPSIFDLGEIGLTGGGFEISPDDALALDGLIGASAARDALSTGQRWAPLRPEVLWSFEGGVRWFDDDVRVELTGFTSEFVDTISRRIVIADRPVVGRTVGGETIQAQDELGRIFVGADPDPVVSRANIGSLRVWGIEALLQRSFSDVWMATVKASLQRGTELDTGFHARKISPDNVTAILRWRSRSGRLSLEGVVKGARAQGRLNPGDLEDTRIGAFRDAGDIEDFFVNQGPRLGLVQDGVLLATGETLDQVIARVLGANGVGAPLFARTPGWVTLAIRGNYAISDRQTLTFALSNLTDANYRMHGSGFDALGISLTAAYSIDF